MLDHTTTISSSRSIDPLSIPSKHLQCQASSRKIVRVFGTDKNGQFLSGFLGGGLEITGYPRRAFPDERAARSAIARALAYWGGRVRFALEDY